jgi:hypothetical protein
MELLKCKLLEYAVLYSGKSLWGLDCDLQQLQIELEKIDCLIHASVCRDILEQATARVVHAQLGQQASCAYFVLSNA